MTVREIVKAKLVELGADGLCSPSGDCHCSIDNLFHFKCCSERDSCVPAISEICTNNDSNFFGSYFFEPMEDIDHA